MEETIHTENTFIPNENLVENSFIDINNNTTISFDDTTIPAIAIPTADNTPNSMGISESDFK